MDQHTAIESFAEAWVAARTPTAVNVGQEEHQEYSTTTQLPGATKMTSPTKLLPVSSPTGSPLAELSPLSSSSSPCTRSLPIHCIIEQTSGSPSFETSLDETSTHNTVELDSYAILPGTTLLSECVRAALLKLGYNSTETIGAKGAIQLKNWKPLGFDTITDNKSASIDDILGELTQVATLRIRMCRTFSHGYPVNEWTGDNVRSVVLELLQEMTQTDLSVLSPLPQSMISNLINSKYKATLSKRTVQAFGDWYLQYRHHKSAPHTLSKPVNSRLTFHVLKEVPKMKLWFERDKNPCERQVIEYVNELNTSIVRRERPQVTIEKLKNWFKNERQKLKRKRNEGSGSRKVEDSGIEGEHTKQKFSYNKHVKGYLCGKGNAKVKHKEQTTYQVNQAFTPNLHSHSHFSESQGEGHYSGQQGEGHFHRLQGEGHVSWCDDHMV